MMVIPIITYRHVQRRHTARAANARGSPYMRLPRKLKLSPAVTPPPLIVTGLPYKPCDHVSLEAAAHEATLWVAVMSGYLV